MPEARLPRAWPPPARAGRARTPAAGSGAIVSPMQGTVLAVKVADGDIVEVGQVICIVEAMKMENEVTAIAPARSSSSPWRWARPVTNGQAICAID